jgi:hypothetical protein
MKSWAFFLVGDFFGGHGIINCISIFAVRYIQEILFFKQNSFTCWNSKKHFASDKSQKCFSKDLFENI